MPTTITGSAILTWLALGFFVGLGWATATRLVGKFLK